MAVLMDGKALAAEMMESLRQRVNALKEAGRAVGLAVILVGDDPASQPSACPRRLLRRNWSSASTP